jgi:hypothetical protein
VYFAKHLQYLVESFPILKHTPTFLAPWKKMALEGRVRGRGYIQELVKEVKDKME